MTTHCHHHNIAIVKPTTSQLRRSNWHWLVCQLFNNTDLTKQTYIDAKVYRLKARLQQLLDMSVEDIDSKSKNADVQTEEQLYFFRAAHRYVIDVLETYGNIDKQYIKALHEWHDQCCGFSNKKLRWMVASPEDYQRPTPSSRHVYFAHKISAEMVTMRMPQTLKDDLQTLANDKDISLSNYIRRVLDNHVEMVAKLHLV